MTFPVEKLEPGDDESSPAVEGGLERFDCHGTGAASNNNKYLSCGGGGVCGRDDGKEFSGRFSCQDHEMGQVQATLP